MRACRMERCTPSTQSRWGSEFICTPRSTCQLLMESNVADSCMGALLSHYHDTRYV